MVRCFSLFPGPSQKIDKYCTMAFDEAQRFGDWNSDKSYVYPCSLIINKCNHDYAQLKET